MKIRIRLYLYALLVVSVLIQAYSLKFFSVFPDVIILLTVFTGMFFGAGEGLILGIFAGLLRGSFSQGTILIDVVVFPIVGLLSSVLAKMFYHKNPAFQIFTALVSVFVVVSFQTVYLNYTGGNDIELFYVFFKSWPSLLLTILGAPVFFALVETLIKPED